MHPRKSERGGTTGGAEVLEAGEPAPDRSLLASGMATNGAYETPRRLDMKTTRRFPIPDWMTLADVNLYHSVCIVSEKLDECRDERNRQGWLLLSRVLKRLVAGV